MSTMRYTLRESNLIELDIAPFRVFAEPSILSEAAHFDDPSSVVIVNTTERDLKLACYKPGDSLRLVASQTNSLAARLGRRCNTIALHGKPINGSATLDIQVRNPYSKQCVMLQGGTVYLWVDNAFEPLGSLPQRLEAATELEATSSRNARTSTVSSFKEEDVLAKSAGLIPDAAVSEIIVNAGHGDILQSLERPDVVMRCTRLRTGANSTGEEEQYKPMRRSTQEVTEDIKHTRQDADHRWRWAMKSLKNVASGMTLNPEARAIMQQHWLEATDYKHRYGGNLVVYFEHWTALDVAELSANESRFFYWLDYGGGKHFSHDVVPREKLEAECVAFLDENQRKVYCVDIRHGQLVFARSGEVVDTVGEEFIFVMAPRGELYLGRKRKGYFHHSSFLSAGAVLGAGTMEVDRGTLKKLIPHSGHYMPNDRDFLKLLERLRDQGVDLDSCTIGSVKAPKAAGANITAKKAAKAAKKAADAAEARRLAQEAAHAGTKAGMKSIKKAEKKYEKAEKKAEKAEKKAEKKDKKEPNYGNEDKEADKKDKQALKIALAAEAKRAAQEAGFAHTKEGMKAIKKADKKYEKAEKKAGQGEKEITAAEQLAVLRRKTAWDIEAVRAASEQPDESQAHLRGSLDADVERVRAGLRQSQSSHM